MTLFPQIAEPLLRDSRCDEELRDRVALHLRSCRPELRRVEVLVKDGIVTLRGELSTFFLRQLAAERTRRVAGVRLLVDQIEVPPLLHGFHRSPK
jgi:osmotically-inducible protein OsmY